ncbi:MAG TPA: hypothetical protein P5072_05465, partial [Parvularculaceae bacterium]|nr:hypothetical protein [Parvularculaceae bacterium]
SFFSGAQLLSTAIIGEYLGRLYIESKGRPLFLIAADTAKEKASSPDWNKVRSELLGAPDETAGADAPSVTTRRSA